MKNLKLSGMFQKIDSDGKGLERKGSFQRGLELEDKKAGQGGSSRKNAVGLWDR